MKWMVWVLWLGLSFAVCAQDQRSGTIKSVQGEVAILQKGEQRSAIVAGAVQETDHIVTGRNGNTTFTLKDGTVVAMGPATALDVVKVRFDPVTQDGSIGLSLVHGVVRIVTGVLGKLHPEQVEIATPTSVVGVRGTDFIVEAP